MPSTDIDGTPILILGLPVVRDLYKLLGTPETEDQKHAVERLFKFLDDPQCINWSQDNAKSI